MGEFGYSAGRSRHEVVSGKSYGVVGGGAQAQAQAQSPSFSRGHPPPRAARGGPSQNDSKPWSFNDPESKRKQRIYKYNVYSVEGRVKASVRKGFRWIKNKCSKIVRGY